MATNDDLVKAINSLKGVPVKKNICVVSASPKLLASIELASQCEVRYLVEMYKKNGLPLPTVDSYDDISGYDNQDIANDVYHKTKDLQYQLEMQKQYENDLQKEDSQVETGDNKNTVAVAAASSQQAGDE